MDTQELFRRLVANAFDFLTHSIEELDAYPKYAVIHLNAAVELFLKARLMSDHWSLVVAHGQRADWTQFVAGDFRSVSLDEAVDKLDKILQSGLTEREIRVFKDIAHHRNKTVHFFHEADYASRQQDVRRVIAREQLCAGYFLHRLLKDKWLDVFGEWSTQIDGIYDSLKARRAFLQVVFDEKAPTIQERIAHGSRFCPCPSCGFDALEHAGMLDRIETSTCLVCNLVDRVLTIVCSHCGEKVDFVGEGLSACESCGADYEPADVAGRLVDEQAAYVATKDGDDSYDLGNCNLCDGYQTVVLDRAGDHVCTNCFQRFDCLSRCGWCNEPNSGDMGDSYVAGCNHCGGLVGHDRS